MDEQNYRFTTGSEIADLKRLPCLQKVAPYAFGNGEKIVFKPGYTFTAMQKDHPTWDAGAAVDGANRMLELACSGWELLYDLDDPEAKLLYFPSKGFRHEKQPYIILAAGGGYFGVCSLVESIPAAAYLNEQGWDVFCLNYRSAKLGLMPKPLEDMASALRCIRDHAAGWGLDRGRYVVGGFSAGAHLAGMWGTEKHGYAAYGLPAPECVWLCYPMVSAELEEKVGKVSTLIVKKVMFGLMGGKKQSAEWALDRQIGPGYPPTYLIMAKDDDTIPQKLYEDLKRTLMENHIPVKINHVAVGGHGYGLGRGTDAEGWLDEAIRFWTIQCGRDGSFPADRA